MMNRIRLFIEALQYGDLDAWGAVLAFFLIVAILSKI